MLIRSYMDNCNIFYLSLYIHLFFTFFLFHSVLIQYLRHFFECAREYRPLADRHAPGILARPFCTVFIDFSSISWSCCLRERESHVIRGPLCSKILTRVHSLSENLVPLLHKLCLTVYKVSSCNFLFLDEWNPNGVTIQMKAIEQYFPAGTACFVARGSTFWICALNSGVWPSKWKLLSSTLLWYGLLCCTR